MAIIDSTLEFSVAQTAADGAKSTNKIDLGADRNIGPGRAMWVVVQINDDQASESVVALETSETEGGAFVEIATVTVPAGAVSGSRFVMGVPYKNERFLQLSYTKAGKYTAWLTDQEPTSWQAYPGVV